MSKALRSVLVGVVIGTITTLSIGVIADNMHQITENPYPVSINGRIESVEGYNIDGSTYFKLRDIGTYTGFDVDFNEGVITINTNDTVLATDGSNSTNEPVRILDEANQNILSWKVGDEVYYAVSTVNLQFLKNIRLDIYPSGDDAYNLEITDITNTQGEVLGTLNYQIINDAICISETDLKTIVLPLDNK